MPRRLATLLIALSFCTALITQANAQAVPADLVLRNGRIYTMTVPPLAEAVAIRDGRVVAVGPNQAVDQLAGPRTKVIELEGRSVIPGLIESHGHFVSLGESLMTVDLVGATTYDEVVARVAKAVRQARPGEWITGRGWHQEKWIRPPRDQVEGTPIHTALSKVSPQNPVLLTHASGHMCLANALAMKLGGITRDSKDPPGGTILRDAQGRPTGVLRENAMAPVRRAYNSWLSQQTEDERDRRFRQAVELAGRECLRFGVTSFHDAGVSFATVDRYRQLAADRQLPVRLYVMLNASNSELARRMADYRTESSFNHFLTIRAVKRLIDGALGSHGAWLLEPYEDLPGSTGLQTLSSKSLRETARLCVEHNYQLCVHAIGDRANREVLDIFTEALGQAPDGRQRRWRIEHAQHLHPEDIPRFRQLGVIASMQAIHATSDAPFVVARLGMRRAKEGAYVWRSLLDHGAIIANGTDVPVESVNPFACLFASVTRQVKPGVAFFPEQCMTRREAFESYTVNGAWASFSEKLKGRLAVGMLADLVVLPVDPFRCSDTELAECTPDLTVLGGHIVYERPVQQ